MANHHELYHSASKNKHFSAVSQVINSTLVNREAGIPWPSIYASLIGGIYEDLGIQSAEYNFYIIMTKIEAPIM